MRLKKIDNLGTKSYSEKEFNIQKEIFCQTKAAKYECQMPRELVRMLQMIPKFIN